MSEIENTSAQIMSFARQMEQSLSNKTTQELNDLEHRSSELKLSPDFSTRVGAEIINVGCKLNLEKRKGI